MPFYDLIYSFQSNTDQPPRGVKGRNGVNGVNGRNGVSGRNGRNGVNGCIKTLTPNGVLPSIHATGFPFLSTNVPFIKPPNQRTDSEKKYPLFINPIHCISLLNTFLFCGSYHPTSTQFLLNIAFTIPSYIKFKIPVQNNPSSSTKYLPIFFLPFAKSTNCW